jgi:hypothetical protein
VPVAQRGSFRRGWTIYPKHTLAVLAAHFDPDDLNGFSDPVRDKTPGCGASGSIVPEEQPMNCRVRGSSSELCAGRKD